MLAIVVDNRVVLFVVAAVGVIIGDIVYGQVPCTCDTLETCLQQKAQLRQRTLQSCRSR